jgi:hypothetical protein
LPIALRRRSKLPRRRAESILTAEVSRPWTPISSKEFNLRTACVTYVDFVYHRHDIASKGGKASSGSFEPGSEKAKEAGRKGGQSS